MKKEEKEEPREIGFVTVLNIIVGIILLIFAISTLVMGLFLSGILFLVLTIFIFFPQKLLRFNKWFKLLIAIVGFVVIIIVVGFNAPSQELEFVNYNLNEEFVITYNNINFSMIVSNIDKENIILVDGEEKTTSGIFLLVHGSVTNLGNMASNFGFLSELLDNQNNSYSLFSFDMGEGAMQPNLKKDFLNVFEIPKTASGLKFIVADETKIIKKIDLGI